MAKRTLNLALATGVLALGISTAGSAGGIASASMLANTCTGCHGRDGNSLGPASPSIAQMEKTAFIEAMQAFKSGKTYGTIMDRIAKGYTDEEIERMADYFAARRFVPAKQEFDATKAGKGARLHDKYCEKCHENGGRPITGEDAEYYLLAGQWLPYLENTIADFRAGRREIPKKMKKKLDKLIKKEGEAGLAAINAFYADQR
ncbi:MAG: c-type cytochrome [Candidatus Thiosymbion ectosymbiont of Robbea hypermnestra]|nr:c-type cytochrome [Candidatus Thiosymbion ectosymbiont of Robbea hypermnestra]